MTTSAARQWLDGTTRPDEIARSSLRLTVGKENTDVQIERVLEMLPRFVERLRSLSPLSPEVPRPDLVGVDRG